MIHEKTRGWFFLSLGIFFSVTALLRVGTAHGTDLTVIVQVGGGLVLLATGVGYIREIDPIVESVVTTVLASAGFGAAFVGFVGIFTL